MWQKNNGWGEEEVLQNQFTSYVSTAIQRRRNQYIQQLLRQQSAECLTDEVPLTMWELEYSLEQDFFHELPLLMQIENDRLLYALKAISERERHVFLAHVLEDKSFEVLAEEMGLSYKGTAAIYYRALLKMKEWMKEVKL